MLRSGYLIGVLGFVAVAGIHSFMTRPTAEQAIHFKKFKAERIAACAEDGLPKRDCRCLIENAANHRPLPQSKRLPRFNGDVKVTLASVMAVSDDALKDAYIQGRLSGAMSNLSDYKSDNDVVNTLLNAQIKRLRVRAAQLAMAGCVPEEIFETHATYAKRGKKYYDVPYEMKRTFRVAEKRRKMIEAGEITLASRGSK